MAMITSCCALLAQALPGRVAFPGNAAYAAVEQSYWSLQEASVHPACIVTPRSADEVAKAVSSIDCDFAIKSQGHAPVAGFANIEGGITIDMTALNSVSLKSGGGVARVGTGASWLEVYAALDPHNLTVAGGRNGQVGVGGLTLGGGISYIGPRVGWACDNVVNFEVVLATGELVNANQHSKPDLFRALKGGANNFGVVTAIDFQTFSQGEILAGFITSPFSQRKAVFKAFSDLAGAKHYDPYAEIVTATSYSGANGWGSVLTIAAYTKAETKPAALQPFVNVYNTTNTLQLRQISAWSNESAIPVVEQLFYTGTYGASAELMDKMVDKWDQILKATGDIPGLSSWGFVFEPLPTVFTQYGDKNGGNSLGTSPKDGNAMILLLSPSWNNTSSDTLVYKTAQKLIKAADDVASSMGLLHRFQYLNYAGPTQTPLASYGASNLAALRATSKKYDPKRVFQRKVPGGFKLW